MTVMEYLSQGYRLDMKIKSMLEEQRVLTEMSRSVSSPRLCERVQTSKNADAPFVRYCERAEDLGIRITSEVEKLFNLKEQIRKVIEEVEDPNEQMVLRYRYIHGYSWERIHREMHVGRATVFRWHSQALRHVRLPEDPIFI